jgi:large subunit ribosomal protein L5
MENLMREIRIEKVVLNIGCGKDKNPEHAAKILKTVTGINPVITKTHKRSTFGVAKGKAIGAMMTIRKNPSEILKKMFAAVDNKIKASNFDKIGNFAFGITEYTMIPNTKYDPNVDLMGLDVCVTLVRPGYHIKKKRHPNKVGTFHVIKKEEAIEWVKKNFNVKIAE